MLLMRFLRNRDGGAAPLLALIDGNGTLLKNCATKPSMYYDVDQAIELSNVFSSIAQNLANLRITK